MSAFRNNELFKAEGLTLDSSTNHVAAGTTNATTGRTGPIDISRISNGLLIVTTADAPTGTTWAQTSAATSIGGALLSTSGYTYGQISNGYTLTNLGRIRWEVGGTTPSFTGVSFSIHGRP